MPNIAPSRQGPLATIAGPFCWYGTTAVPRLIMTGALALFGFGFQGLGLG